MSVDEVVIRQIALDQTAIVSLDAYPDEVFELTIKKIYPTKDQKTQTFMVEAFFNNPPDRLFVGLSGEANIIIQKSENAIWIPNEYLFNVNMVKTPDGEVEISLGLRNMYQVQVLEGIDTSTILIKS
jgi:multidrug efflux pump subunit AcrA (membrane-fusion protein)